MLIYLREIVIWKNAYFFDLLILTKNILSWDKMGLNIVTCHTLCNSIGKPSGWRCCISSFIARNCTKSYRICSNRLDLLFLLKTYSWTETLRGTETEVERHNPKIVGISEISTEKQVHLSPDLILLRIDVQNESNLSILELQIPK